MYMAIINKKYPIKHPNKSTKIKNDHIKFSQEATSYKIASHKIKRLNLR